MRMRTLLAAAAVLSTVTSVSAEQLIRVNEAGYFPNSRKNLVIISDEEISGTSWKISDPSGTSLLSGTVERGSTETADSPKRYNYRVDFTSLTTEGEFLFHMGSEEKQVTVKKNPYDDIITSSLRWLRSQRSGSAETVDRDISHQGDKSAPIFRKKDPRSNKWENWIEDENGATAEMSGGWYAANNFSKFTSSIAYTTYYLLRAYDTNPALFEKKNSQSVLNDILDEASFGLSYLMKIMPNDKDFIIQVGGFDSENGTRLPAEDQYDGKRLCYSAFSHPQMGLSIAALALGSRIFENEGAVEEAQQYRKMAEKIYDKAISGNHSPAWLQKGYAQFKDDTRYDNLLLGAMEMYRLTGDEKYQNRAKEFSKRAKAAYWAGWNMQHMMAHSLIAKDYPAAMNYLKEDLNGFASHGRNQTNIWGFPAEPSYGSYYMGLNIGIGSARYQEITGSDHYSDMIHNVLDYGFGVNNWGVSFTASPKLKNSVTQFNLPVYKLQTHLFPEGAVALGPCDRDGHDGESKWILDDVRNNYCYRFNTPNAVFLDHADDYMTMDSWIFGAADNIYFLTLASTLYGN